MREQVASGRTTRMLKRAKELALAGRTVYVLAANEIHRKLLEDVAIRFVGIDPVDLDGIKFETERSLPDFDWITWTLVGAHPNCIVLADHWAIEKRFGHVLAELHRYSMDKGPWHGRLVEGKTYVESDDFTYDVALAVHGDFGSEDEKLRYAADIANLLNGGYHYG